MATQPPDSPTVVDLRAVALALREETLFTLATVEYARRSLRGVKVPRALRRALANAERAAQAAREQARRLDDLMSLADGPARPRA